MASIHKYLLICGLYKDTAYSSDCLMSNVWLMGDEFIGGRRNNSCIISFGYKSEGRIFESRWFHCIFHGHIPSVRNMTMGST